MPHPSVTLRNGPIELVFHWQDDRYQHVVAYDDTELASNHGAALDTPVFTEAHQQGELLFLSGQSGGRHWSASIEPDREGFAFDVACRVKAADRPAGSCYQGNGKGLQIVATGGDSMTDREGLATVIRPAETTTTTPYTLRYRYRITPATPIE